MKKSLPVILLIFVLFGCSGNFPAEHEQFLSSEGWNIKKKTYESTHVLEFREEIFQAWEFADFEPDDYIDKEITVCSYVLKEKQITNG